MPAPPTGSRAETLAQFVAAQVRGPGPAWFCRVPCHPPDTRPVGVLKADATIEGQLPDMDVKLLSIRHRVWCDPTLQGDEDHLRFSQATDQRISASTHSLPSPQHRLPFALRRRRSGPRLLPFVR